MFAKKRGTTLLMVLALSLGSITAAVGAQWQDVTGDELQVLFKNKTHKGSGFAIYYDGNGNRVLNWEGSNQPATYKVDQDGYEYSSGAGTKRAKIEKSGESDPTYRICQNGDCWDFQPLDGNVDDLK